MSAVLPHHAIPIALLFFNQGVEIGQLVFVAAVFTAGGLLRHAIALCLEPPLVQRTADRLDVTAAYAIGIVAKSVSLGLGVPSRLVFCKMIEGTCDFR
jgi:hypothetical protein